MANKVSSKQKVTSDNLSKVTPPTAEETLRALDIHPTRMSQLPSKFMTALADEVAKTVIQRLPGMIRNPRRNQAPKQKSKFVGPLMFLDTSAIIDGRIFDVIS